MNPAQFPGKRHTVEQAPIKGDLRFSKAAGGSGIHIKRDDLPALTAGDKIRELKFPVADVRKQDTDTLIVRGAPALSVYRNCLSALEGP